LKHLLELLSLVNCLDDLLGAATERNLQHVFVWSRGLRVVGMAYLGARERGQLCHVTDSNSSKNRMGLDLLIGMTVF
jgi:hypothetical protein